MWTKSYHLAVERVMFILETIMNITCSFSRMLSSKKIYWVTFNDWFENDGNRQWYLCYQIRYFTKIWWTIKTLKTVQNLQLVRHTAMIITMTSQWVWWCPKSPAFRLFTLFVQAQIKDKHQSFESMAFLRGIHQWPVNSPNKGPAVGARKNITGRYQAKRFSANGGGSQRFIPLSILVHTPSGGRVFSSNIITLGERDHQQHGRGQRWVHVNISVGVP